MFHVLFAVAGRFFLPVVPTSLAGARHGLRFHRVFLCLSVCLSLPLFLSPLFLPPLFLFSLSLSLSHLLPLLRSVCLSLSHFQVPPQSDPHPSSLPISSGF